MLGYCWESGFLARHLLICEGMAMNGNGKKREYALSSSEILVRLLQKGEETRVIPEENQYRTQQPERDRSRRFKMLMNQLKKEGKIVY